MKKHAISILLGLLLALALAAIIVFSKGTQEIFIYNNF